MTQIIDFNSKKNILTVEDFFALFIMFKSKDDLGILVEFDLSKLMYSLPRWRGMEKFKNLYGNIEINLDENNIEYINLVDLIAKKIKEKVVISYGDAKFLILANEELFSEQRKQYKKSDLDLFNQLMFYINNDLEFGIGNWEVFSQDEVVQVDKYPSYVSGEFVEQDKRDYYKNKFGLNIIIGDIDGNGGIDAYDAGIVLNLTEGTLKFEDMTKNNQYYNR